MASSYEDYLKQIRAANQPSLNAEIAASNAIYDSQIKTIQENYDQQIKDTTAEYETAYRQNEVQKLLNERAVARRNAELGLTDSGANLTGQLGVQLSYANQKGAIDLQKQRAVDTLAATMRAQITELAKTKNTNATSIRSSYESSAQKQASDLITQGNKNKAEARNNVISAILNPEYSDEAKYQFIRDWAYEYDATIQEMKDLLKYDSYLKWETLVPEYNAGNTPVIPNRKLTY
jgi:hypothetical protein